MQKKYSETTKKVEEITKPYIDTAPVKKFLKEEKIKNMVDMTKMGYNMIGSIYGGELINFVQYIDDSKKEVLKQLNHYKYK